MNWAVSEDKTHLRSSGPLYQPQEDRQTDRQTDKDKVDRGGKGKAPGKDLYRGIPS